MTHWQANILLLIAGAIWGMGFIAQASAMDSIGPFLFIALRFAVASVVILPFTIMEARRFAETARRNTQLQRTSGNQLTGGALTRSDWLKFSAIGVCLFLGMATQQVGLLSTSVTNSGFLTGLYVVFTPLIGRIVFRNTPHPIVWIAATISVAGIYFLSGGDVSQLVVGDFLTIVSAVFWALQVVLIARYVGHTGRALALSQVQFCVTFGLALFVAMLIEPIVFSAIVSAAPQILFAGIFASGLAFTLQVIGQRYTSAPQAAIFLSSEAPFAAMFAYLWLNELIGQLGILGCFLILLAMLLVELVPMWWKRPKTHAA